MAYSTSKVIRKRWPKFGSYNSSSVQWLDYVDRTHTRVGQRVLGWRNLIRKNQNAASAFSRTSWYHPDEEPCVYAMRARHRLASTTRADKSATGMLFANQSISAVSVPGSAENEALRKLYNRLRETRSQMNGGLFLGELRETLHMIRNPAESLVKFFTSYAKTAKRLRRNMMNKGATVKRINKALAGLWLEAQFGAAPLISDIQSGAETIARLLHGNAERHTRVSASAEFQATSIDPPFTPGNSSPNGLPYLDSGPTVYFVGERRRTSTRGVRYVCGLKSITDGPADSLSRVLEGFGFTLENFVPTIYNLLPYSFLLDYFSNLGDLITAGFTDTSNVAWIVKTVRNLDETAIYWRFDEAQTRKIAALTDWIVETLSGQGGHSKVVRATLERTLPTTLPMPTLEFSIPGASSKKWANMLALFVSGASGAHSHRG